MTPTLTSWAAKWGVPSAALQDLCNRMLGLDCDMTAREPGHSEAHVQARIRLEAASKGMRLWRNSVGALTDERGIPVRFGLANDSPKVNKVLKSGDLIGIRPIHIGPQHVGQVIGQFVSRECKKSSWRYTGTEHEVAQANWVQLVNSLGGDAAFANWEGTL